LFGLRTNRAIGKESKDITYKYPKDCNTLPFPDRTDERILFQKIIENLKAGEDWAIEIEVKGGLLGYNVTVTSVGNETVNGSLKMNISTNALFTLIGRILKIDEEINFPHMSYHICDLHFHARPLIGFGRAKIIISGEFKRIGYTVLECRLYPFEQETNGFVLLFFVGYDGNPITLP